MRAARDRSSGASLLAVSDDARAAAKALEAWLAKSTRQRMHVAADGSWLQVGDGPRQSLRELPTHARILAWLVELYARGPSAQASTAELFAAGWPGERIGATAAANRLAVTLTQLRKLGLADVLERASNGCRLHPDWAVLTDS